MSSYENEEGLLKLGDRTKFLDRLTQGLLCSGITLQHQPKTECWEAKIPAFDFESTISRDGKVHPVNCTIWLAFTSEAQVNGLNKQPIQRDALKWHGTHADQFSEDNLHEIGFEPDQGWITEVAEYLSSNIFGVSASGTEWPVVKSIQDGVWTSALNNLTLEINGNFRVAEAAIKAISKYNTHTNPLRLRLEFQPRFTCLSSQKGGKVSLLIQESRGKPWL